MVFKMLSMDDVCKSNLQPYDDLEEGEIIEDDSESVCLYDAEHCSTTLHNYMQNEDFLSVSNEHTLNTTDNTTSVYNSLHQSRICVQKQAPAPSVHTKSLDKTELKALDWRHSTRKSCKNVHFRRKKYDWKRSPSVSSLSNCSCSSCSPVSSEESKSTHMKGGHQFSRKGSSNCHHQDRSEINLLALKVKKDAKFSTAVRKKEFNYPRYSEKAGNFPKLKKKSLYHNAAYQKAIDSEFQRRRTEILQNYNFKSKPSSQHPFVPKKKDEHSYLPPSLREKESSHRDSTKLKDVKSRGSVKSKLIPGSLGEMLLKNQMKGRLKTMDSLNLETKPHNSKTFSSMSTVNDIVKQARYCDIVKQARYCQSADFNLAVKNTIGLKEEENDDEEDELTLRYKALQSAVKSCGPSSLIKSDLNKILAAAKKDLDKSAKVCNPLEVCTVKSPQQITVLGDDNAKDGFENLNEIETTKDKCELAMVDMEISNDSINDCNYLHEDEKQRNLKNDRSSDQSSVVKMKSCIPKAPILYDPVKQDSQFSFPIEWAYMIPPPPQPGQPDNNLNSVNSWCYNQNMYVQSMEETPTTSEGVNQDLTWQSMKMAPSSSESYSTYSHPYQFPFQSSDVSDPTLGSNIQDANYDANRGFCYQQQPGESTENDELRDAHAEQYRTFMSTVLHNSCHGLFNRKEKHRDLVEINLKPLVKSRPQRTSNTHLRMSNRSLPHKRKLRRRRRGTRKNVFVDAAKNTAIIPPKTTTLDISPNKSLTKENNLAAEDEDEDILRAQLLNDMALKNKSQPLNIGEKNENKIIPEKVEIKSKITMTIPQTTTTLSQKKRIVAKPMSSFSLKQSRKWQNNEKPSKVNVFKQPVKCRPRLDIGGRYLDPKNRFCEVPQTDGFSLSKFPPVKPVIIPLSSSDSDTSEVEMASAKIQDKKSCESVISGIFELIKSCRNSQVKTVSRKMDATNSQTPKSVHHLSKERQEEYRKLRALLVSKKKTIQMRKAASVKAGLSGNRHATALTPSTVQPEAKLENIRNAPHKNAENCQLETTEGHIHKVSQEVVQIVREEPVGENCTTSNTVLPEENPVSDSNVEHSTTKDTLSSCPEEKEFPVLQEEEICPPLNEYSDHSYSKTRKKVTDCTVEIIPSDVLLETDEDAGFSADIKESPDEEMSVSSKDSEQEDDDDDSSSSSESSSSSSDDSDSESEVDQIEIALRNKLLQKRHELLLKRDKAAISSCVLSKEHQPENDQVCDKDMASQIPFQIEPLPEAINVKCDIINTFPLDSFSALGDVNDSDDQPIPPPSFCFNSHSNPPFTRELGQLSNEHISKELQLAGTDCRNFSADSLGNLEKIDDDDDVSLKNINITTNIREEDSPLREMSCHSNSESDKQSDITVVKAVTSPQKNRATAAALMRSLKDANLKTRIMRGEHRKHLKKQIEEEIKKKDLSKRMFTSRICTLLEEATIDDNICQGLFTQIVKLFSQIDILQKERKEKVSTLTVNVAKVSKLLQKLDEDIRTLTELQKLGNQVMSTDECFSIPNLDLTADEEQRKSFLLQMNTLHHNLRQNLTQEQLLSKTFSSRLDPRPTHRGKTKREFLSRQAPSTNPATATRKFKVDNRPLSHKRTELEGSGIGLSPNIPKPIVVSPSSRMNRTFEQPQSHRQTSVIGYRKEEETSTLGKVAVFSLLTDDDRDKSVEDLGILCPHDLLGRCNDDFCVYQHTSAAGQVRGDSNSPAASGSSSCQSVPGYFDRQFGRILERLRLPSHYPNIEKKALFSSPEASANVKNHSVSPPYPGLCLENDGTEEEDIRRTSAQDGAAKDSTFNFKGVKNSAMAALAVLPRPSLRGKRKSRGGLSVRPKSKKKICTDPAKESACPDALRQTPSDEDSSTIQWGISAADDVVCLSPTPLTDAEPIDLAMQVAESPNLPPAQPSPRSLRGKLRRGRARALRPVRSSRRIQEKLKKH